MDARKTDYYLTDYKNRITQAIKSLKEYYQEKNKEQQDKPLLQERKIVINQTNRFSFFPNETKQLVEKAQELIIIAKEAVNTSRLNKKHDLILKNNSPVFRMPNKELPKVNILVDKTPIDPYHAWAIVSCSGK